MQTIFSAGVIVKPFACLEKHVRDGARGVP